MEQKLEDQEGTALNLHETYTSLHTEVDTKTKKLKKVCSSPFFFFTNLPYFAKLPYSRIHLTHEFELLTNSSYSQICLIHEFILFTNSPFS